MKTAFFTYLSEQTRELQASGLYREERIITSPQQATIKVMADKEALNFCTNNYLGLSNPPDLGSICDLADKYSALVMVDDSHAVGFIGDKGRGTHEYCDVMGRVDILTGTLGKALGGASGGYTSGKKEIITRRSK